MRISDWSSDVCSSDLTTQALDQIRPGASRDLASAMQRDPALLREAAAGRSGPMIEAMAQEARVRADPNLRADRFVERWQGLKQERDRLYRSEEHTSELQSLMRIPYAVFCLKKKKKNNKTDTTIISGLIHKYIRHKLTNLNTQSLECHIKL